LLQADPLDHEFVLWLGDLNYRIAKSLSYAQVAIHPE
jgi:hypothetical protein